MNEETKSTLIEWAEKYNDPKYFSEDPIIFPKKFAAEYSSGACGLADVEIAAVLAAHLAWGRRSMIVRDCGRMFDEMGWKPYDYVMNGEYRDEDVSLHRTIKWSEFAGICGRLRGIYSGAGSIEGMSAAGSIEGLSAAGSIEGLSVERIRAEIFGSKEDRRAPNKKINMMRRWMVRRDGIVDLGLWRNSSPSELIIPLDVHVYSQAVALGLTRRKSLDLTTAMEITDAFKEIFPGDPCKGDFALFGYGVTKGEI